MGELGDLVSCLFPTTVSLYRRSGYEVGGVQQRTTYAGSTLRELGSLATGRGLSRSLGSPGSPGAWAFGSSGASGSPRASGSAGTSGSSGPSGLSEQPTLRPRRARPDDAEAIHRMLRDDAERHARSGPMPRGVEQLRGMIERDELITYVVPDGVVVYDLAADAVTVEHLVAGSSETAAALWGLVGSGSSAVPTVHTYLDPRDPLTLALGDLPAVEVRQVPWMARVIDLGASFAGRGFAPLVRADLDLVVDDPEAPRNTGRWQLSVADGSGTAVRSDADPADGRVARVDPRGLSALWCGWSTSRLRQAGLLEGGSPDDDVALDAIFAATPYITEYF